MAKRTCGDRRFLGLFGLVVGLSAIGCGPGEKPGEQTQTTDDQLVVDARPSKVAHVIRQRAKGSMQARQKAARVSNLSDRVLPVSDYGEIEVLIHAVGPVGSQEIAELVALGATPGATLEARVLPALPAPGLINAWVPASAIDALDALLWIAAVTPPGYSEPDVTSEGVALHRADIAQAQNIDGTGITIGVMSDGVSNLAASQALGELPAACPGTPCINVLTTGSGDEGTAMLELINDMAPGANLAFRDGFGVVNHVNGLNALVAAGVNVIAEDIPFDGEPVFQQGLATQTAEAIATAGVSIHSSAGNQGARHAARVTAIGTGTGPDGVVFAATPPGCSFTPDNVVAIAPGGDTTFDTFGGEVTLQWSEPRAIFPTTGQGGFTDLNVYIMDTGLTKCLAESVGVQANGVGDTIEFVNIPAQNVKIVVDVQSTSTAVAAPILDLKIRGSAPIDPISRVGSLNPDSNYTGLASSSAAVDAVGFGLESYSAGGPVQLGSTTTCPGGGAGPCTGVAGGGLVTDPGPAPTWTAADNTAVSGVGGFGSPFTGTSAAAPHAAACDALVRQSLGAGATVATVRARLATTAIDKGTPGSDSEWGFGQLDCFAAVGGPKARCHDVPAAAGPTCSAAVTPSQVDAGSTDPNGDPLSLSLAPTGPFGLGNTGVTLTVSDGTYSDTCTATVTVSDVTGPVVTPPPNLSTSTCEGNTLITVGQATATDNCASSLQPTGFVIATNGAPLATPIQVVGGQVTLGVGTHTIRWSASDGPNVGTADQTVTVGSSIQASLSFLVGDRASVVTTTNGGAAVQNSGSGQTRIGSNATTGGILSVGPVQILDHAVVSGSVVSAGAVNPSPTATITGPITQFGSVALPTLPTLPAFPAAGGNVTVNSGTQPISAGSYNNVTVNGGTLVFGSGDFFIRRLIINSATTVRATATTRIFVMTQLDYRSPFRALTGTAIQSVFLGFAGTTTTLEAQFFGTLVAPNAQVAFGVGSGLTFRGSFFARTIELRNNSTLVCVPGVAPPGTPPSPSCMDGLKNGSETAVDCGGPVCAKCSNGNACVGASDCQSGACIGSVCQPGGAMSGSLSFSTDWGAGYCATLLITNNTGSPTVNYSASLNLNASTIYTTWNGTFSGNTGTITVAPAFFWNKVIAPGATNSSIGFCATRTVPGSGVIPTFLSATGTF